jgi:5-methylcytosine-specific restriction endonuclease McrA
MRVLSIVNTAVRRVCLHSGYPRDYNQQMITCKAVGCLKEAIPRPKRKGRHHGLCNTHFWYYDRAGVGKKVTRDEHRSIAFGLKEPEKVRCNICRDSLLEHFDKCCKPFHSDIELRQMTIEFKMIQAIKQFEVDHINGRHGSKTEYNKPSNLQILCPSCHKYKTLINGDLDNTRYKKKALASI